jgi:antitoxin component of MazEF toxin-antitoxin module
MGYPVKIQKVERPTNQSFYLNFPSALAQLLNITKGESFEWEVETKNLILLKRVKQKAPTKLKNGSPDK